MAHIIVDTELDVVDETDAVTSLREALTIAQGTASEADTISFSAAVSNIELDASSGPLVIASEQNVIIDGDSNSDGVANISIDGQGTTRLLTIQMGASATLQGLNLVDGLMQV